MSITWELTRAGDSTAGNRPLDWVSGQQAKTTTNMAGLAVGKLAKVYDGTDGENGLYTIIAVSGQQYMTFAETIPDVADPNSRVAITGPGDRKLSDRSITSILAPGVVWCAGTDMAASGVVPGDRMTIVSTNVNGSFIVKGVAQDFCQVVSAETLSGAPPAGNPGSGKVYIEEGFGRLHVTDEPTCSWDDVQAQYPLLVDDSCGCGDSIKIRHIRCLWNVVLGQTGASGTRWESFDEVIAPVRPPSGSAQYISWLTSGASRLQSWMQLGISGSDIYSATSGSYWYGGALGLPSPASYPAPSGISVEAYGSTFQGHDTFIPGPDSIFRGCNIAKNPGGFIAVSGTEVTTMVMCNDTGYGVSAWGGSGSMEDIFVLDTSTYALIYQTESTIRDFRLGAAVADGAYWLLAGTGHFVDPKEDYSTTRLWTALGTCSGYKYYSYNPRFVSRDRLALSGVAISGLALHVYEINATTDAETEMAGSPFYTGADGRLVSGEILLKKAETLAHSAPGTTTLFRHRLVTNRKGFRTINQTVDLTTKFDGDVAVDFLQTDFEGGLST